MADSLALVPSQDGFYQVTILATVLAAFAYGIVVSLYACCFRALMRDELKYSMRRRRILLGYITAMTLTSTLALIQNILASIFDLSILPRQPSSLSSIVQTPFWILPFTIWGSDGFKLWRCAVLYYRSFSESPGKILIGLWGFLCLTSFALGIFTLLSQFVDQPAGRPGFTAAPIFMLVFSAVLNLTLSFLITLRIISHRKNMRLASLRGSLYTRIIIMCIEACSLIVILPPVYISLFLSHTNGYQIPLLLLPHFCVISPLLIVYRVVDGRDTSTTLNLAEGRASGTGHVDLEIHFTTQVSTRVSQISQADQTKLQILPNA